MIAMHPLLFSRKEESIMTQKKIVVYSQPG